jgi:hypothetical protein
MVSLRARDEQIDILKEVSDRNGAVVLRNCTLELFQGKHIRLAITKWGKLSPYPDQIASTPASPSKYNRDRNFSLIDLSAIATELVAFTDPFVQSPAHSFSSMKQKLYKPNATQWYQGRKMFPPHNEGGDPAPVIFQHYDDPSRFTHTASHYNTSGLHGYGAPTSYMYSDGQENMHHHPRHQHMLLQQQHYEIQHGHLHMYHSPQHRLSHQDTRMIISSHPHSPMMSSSMPPATQFNPTAFGVANYGMPIRNPFMIPATPSTPPRPILSTDERTESPTTPGKMNPQAPAFDPTRK